MCAWDKLIYNVCRVSALVKRQKSQARRVQGEAPALREASAGVSCLSPSSMLTASLGGGAG